MNLLKNYYNDLIFSTRSYIKFKYKTNKVLSKRIRKGKAAHMGPLPTLHLGFLFKFTEISSSVVALRAPCWKFRRNCWKFHRNFVDKL